MEYSKLHTPPNLMPIKRKVQGKVHYHWKSDNWVNCLKKCFEK